MRPLAASKALTLLLAGLLFAGALPATVFAADEPARRAGPRMVLTGRGSAEAKPDFASVSIGVSVRAPAASAALDGTSTAAAKIVASARGFGIDARDIQTSQISLQPVVRNVRDPNGTSEQKPDGYGASNAVTVRVRDLARLGEFLRAVVDGGANRIGGVEFELNDPGRLDREALAAAIRNAREQADTIAGAAGIKLGRIEEIRAGGRGESPMPASYRARRAVAAAPPPDVPVEPGSLQVSSEVEVIFSIGEP